MKQNIEIPIITAEAMLDRIQNRGESFLIFLGTKPSDFSLIFLIKMKIYIGMCIIVKTVLINRKVLKIFQGMLSSSTL